MEFRVIGPVELWINGRRRDLGTPKERCVLAVLLLSPRQPVSAETLIRRVWDDPAPGQGAAEPLFLHHPVTPPPR
ncbi:AfsR/SARP family transcriptional regulator [Actinomadura madurae]|uniref:AfsR/SARP family transcriptional regulator n=1 Tax=Actinomadura madurae TaxID=1993 RepID=UPI0020D24A69|nr:winged helix-turn-helix domain-containing protein [Actinomadura madurae]MCP9979259.1 winged helix-turn-helix domain-containing protein [Actinomadura madurae]